MPAADASATPLGSLTDLNEAIRKFNCGPAFDYINNNNYVLPFGSVAAYFIFIVLGVKAMESQKPMQLKHLFAAWNLSLSLFSLWGVSVAVPYIFNSLTQKGFHYTVCADEIRFGPGSLCDSAMGLAMTLFMFSKFPELFDTVFLVLMKKKIMTLQWWHHATVLLYSWWSAMNALPSCGPMAAMNYSVHGIMYFYFAVSGYTRAFSFLRLPVMLMQLSQMAVGLVIVGRHTTTRRLILVVAPRRTRTSTFGTAA